MILEYKMELNEIIHQFPQLNTKINDHRLVYLDNGATTLKPQVVIDELTTYYSTEVANVHRGVHTLSELGTLRFEETRTLVKDFINAKSTTEIIFTKGTTESINLLASVFAEKFLDTDDEILVSTMDHHSNMVPWYMAAQKKQAKLIEIPITDAGEIDLEAYKKLLNPKVKMVSLCHISNTLGTINPIKEMVELAHQVGAFFNLDAAQSASHLKIDVQELNVDFLAFSSHKMCGPNGVGVFYGKENLLEILPPYQGGGAMISSVKFEKVEYNSLPFKFEAGTPIIAEVIAFKTALKFLLKIGLENIAQHEHLLLNYAEKKLREIDGLKIMGEAKNKASVISFIIDGVHPHDLGTLLNKQGIAIRTGHHCTQPLMKRMNTQFTARASLAFYNTKEDIDCLVNGINKSLEFLK
jgi:cysteine desulfurase/selenocysteine lyase